MDAAQLRELLPPDSDLLITNVAFDLDQVTVDATVVAATADCPACGRPAEDIHSRYARRIRDLPCCGRRLTLVVTVRKFRCGNPVCPRSIFCERLPHLAGTRARTTGPLTASHRAIGFAAGGEAGARLADRLAMPTSPDTLLRRVKAAPNDDSPPPRYIGVDDWAWKKGRRYGTILIDLERRRVIDILPGRDGAALAAWLQDHPTVEVVARDRWSAYAQAVSAGAPQAKQVADRWHLLSNLREAVERLFARHSSAVRATLTPATPPDGQTAADPAPATAPVPSTQDQARQANRDARAKRHRQVRDLRAAGHSLRQIARATGLSVKAVIRYVREETCPNWNRGGPRPTQLDRWAAAIDAWIAGGGRNTADLYRLLREQGCRAGYDAVRRFVNRRLGSSGRPGPRRGRPIPPVPPPPTARKLSFEFIRRPDDRSPEEQGRLDRLRETVPALGPALDLASEFAAMVRKTAAADLPAWLATAERSEASDLRNFAVGLKTDEAAIAAALTERWSTGPVEAQAGRLKLIKRQMYGRAGLPLLRARVRHAA